MKTLLCALFGAALLAPSSFAQTTLITNGRVVTNADAGIIENGSVLVRDGDIVAVGASIENVDEDATVVDAEGGWITPGLFHPHTQLGLVEVALESSTSDASANESHFTAAIDVADAFNPNATHIASTRIEGVTRFALFPSTGSAIIGGRGALGETSGDADSLFATRQFLFADLSQSGASTAGGSRAAAWAFLRAALEDARFYPGRFMAHHEGDAIDRFDAAALVSAARGQIPLVLFVDRAADIRRALAFRDGNQQLQLIIAGGAEAWMVADELAEAGVPVILDPLRNLPGSFDTLASRQDGPALLHAAGVTTAYTTVTADLYFNPRLLAQHAGNAVTAGAQWADAFRSITLTPAEIYGVGDRYGALAPGYAGDVVVWDGDPLEVMSAPVAVLIDGETQSLESRQTRLAERYAELRADGAYAYHH
ncbi:MAG: amidohydrolase family protein [Pseudomonadota bacterium]